MGRESKHTLFESDLVQKIPVELQNPFQRAIVFYDVRSAVKPPFLR
jgi:hypothetical protein